MNRGLYGEFYRSSYTKMVYKKFRNKYYGVELLDMLK